jgi:hypothetical protein
MVLKILGTVPKPECPLQSVVQQFLGVKAEPEKEGKKAS